MSLVEHAERELRLAGLMDPDSDYGGAAGKAILEIVRTFSAQRHSGGSAWLVVSALEKLLRFKPLAPITSNPDEWMEVGDGMWQSTRCPSVFSKDGGKTWYDLDAPEAAP